MMDGINLKVCIIGHYNVKTHDEGVVNVAHNIYKSLSKNKQCELMKLNITSLVKNIVAVKKFNPDVIHYILSPTFSGIIIAKLFSTVYPKTKSVISAPHPNIKKNHKFMSLFKPTIILVQSHQSEKMFQLIGYKTQFLANGVDIEKFRPVSSISKDSLRAKYGIDKSKFVLLHVGSIKEGRNLKILKKLQSESHVQVVIIGSTSTNPDKKIYQDLIRNGCIVWIRYLDNIEEIYALSDCYIFPVTDRFNCIEMPLSVLEAMACNLPVVSTKFGALPRIFTEGNGFYFMDSTTDLTDILEKIKRIDEVHTRDKIAPYSWQEIGNKLVTIYQEMLSDNIQKQYE